MGRLPQPGRSLDFLALALCAVLCRGAHASDGAITSIPFRSALGTDPTRMILQYSMYAREAKAKLTGDLAHLYQENRFQREPRVHVTGAGTGEVNGWYQRREAQEGPPRGWPNEWDDAVWANLNQGRR